MKVYDALHFIVGLEIMLSLTLGLIFHPYWFAWAFMVGFMLFQSSLTKWCPGITLLKKLGFKE